MLSTQAFVHVRLRSVTMLSNTIRKIEKRELVVSKCSQFGMQRMFFLVQDRMRFVSVSYDALIVC